MGALARVSCGIHSYTRSYVNRKKYEKRKKEKKKKRKNVE